jgi:hypothetical protein
MSSSDNNADTTTAASKQKSTSVSDVPSENLLLAVGDSGGSLHIVELPRHLWRTHSNEYASAENFVKHEAKRLSNTHRHDAKFAHSTDTSGGTEDEKNSELLFSQGDQEQHYRHIERKLNRLLHNIDIADVNADTLINALKN